MKVALVHDSFLCVGGGERVAAQLADLFRDAPIYVGAQRAEALPSSIRGRELRSTFAQPLVDRGMPLTALAGLLPAAFGRLDLAAADVVVSSSASFAHHVRPPTSAVHLCYCHTPPGFLWEPDDYFHGRPADRLILSPALAILRRLDCAAARRVDLYVANSEHIAARIRRVYGREATVVYPPVDTLACRPSTERSGRFLVVSRLRNHKRIDLAIEAANRYGLGLDVIGEGPELASLRRLAGPTVRFLGPLSDEAVRGAMARAVGVVVPARQDFGMTLVEAQASGRPPIALGVGGATEIVRDGVTGFLFTEPTPESLATAMARAAHQPLNADALVGSAARFSVAVFRAAITGLVAAAADRRVESIEGTLDRADRQEGPDRAA